MNRPNQPYFEIPASQLASWIEEQGEDVWWNIDGDPLLTGCLSFPCPGDELAEQLRRINKKIFVLVGKDGARAKGQQIGKERLDGLVGRLGNNVHITGPQPAWVNDRVLFLRWEESPEEWLLIEDNETTKSSREDLAAGTKEK